MKWVEDSKALYDAKETSSAELWSDDWKKGFYPERYERLLRRKCNIRRGTGSVLRSRYIVQGVAVGSVKG